MPVSATIESLFRPESLLTRLRRSLEWPEGCVPEFIRLHRLWVGRTGRITFELALRPRGSEGDDEVLLQGLLGKPDKQRRVHRRVRYRGRWVGGVRLSCDDPAVWLCSADRDPKLPVVRNLLSHSRRMGELESLPDVVTAIGKGQKDDGFTTGSIRADVVAYRLGKRCVLRFSAREAGPESQDVYVKVFNRALPPDLFTTVSQTSYLVEAASQGRVRMPSIVAHCSRRRLLVLAAVPTGSRRLESTPKDIEAVAMAAFCLHRLPLEPSLPLHGPEDEIRTVGRWIPVLNVFNRTAANRIDRLLRRLSHESRGINSQPDCRIHRDFYVGQLLRLRETVWVLDADTLCTGHGELDAATYAAHLLLDDLIAGKDLAHGREDVDRFLACYTNAGGILQPDRLPFYLGCALCRLSAIFLTRGTPVATIEQLWAAADRVLDRQWFSG